VPGLEELADEARLLDVEVLQVVGELLVDLGGGHLDAARRAGVLHDALVHQVLDLLAVAGDEVLAQLLARDAAAAVGEGGDVGRAVFGAGRRGRRLRRRLGRGLGAGEDGPRPDGLGRHARPGDGDAGAAEADEDLAPTERQTARLAAVCHVLLPRTER